MLTDAPAPLDTAPDDVPQRGPQPDAAFFDLGGHSAQSVPASPQGFSLALLAAVPDCVKVISLDGRVMFMNENGRCAMEIDDFSRVAGALWEELWPDAARAEVQRAITAARAGETGRFQGFCPTAKGTPCWWDVIVNPIFDGDGRIEALLSVSRDITELHRTQLELVEAHKMEAVGRITAGVAHDFNNLLTVAMTAAEGILALAPENGVERTQAELILGSAERGAELVKRLLAFSRRQPLSPQPVDVGALLEGLKPLIERAVGGAVQLEIQMPPNHAVTCRADFAQLESAILNLCVNARDAMPEGGRLSIAARHEGLASGAAARGLSPRDYVAICVTDSGHGMTPDVMGKAIEPFFTTKPYSHGSGLGLSMVHGFARQSGGALVLESEAGNGLSAWIYLPTASPSSDARHDAPSAAGAARPAQGAHILVVDDDAGVRAGVVRHLEGLGYRVSHASDGRSAVEVLADDASIDLLFSDVEMPGGMNGRQLADRARLLRPKLKVLFTSGYTEDEVLSRSRGAQAYGGFLQKPYRRARLAAAIAASLADAGPAPA